VSVTAAASGGSIDLTDLASTDHRCAIGQRNVGTGYITGDSGLGVESHMLCGGDITFNRTIHDDHGRTNVSLAVSGFIHMNPARSFNRSFESAYDTHRLLECQITDYYRVRTNYRFLIIRHGDTSLFQPIHP